MISHAYGATEPPEEVLAPELTAREIARPGGEGFTVPAGRTVHPADKRAAARKAAARIAPIGQLGGQETEMGV